MHRVLPVLCVLCLLILAARPTHAADIRITDNPLCRISLSGPIMVGDTERLRSVVERAGDTAYLDDMAFPENTQGLRLCLDSPGGSLQEGARLAEYVFEAGIGTVLAPHAHCLSACAWVFMMGFAQGHEDLFFTNRRMHHTARLAFHAPTIEFDEISAISAENALRLVRVMNMSVTTILRVGHARILGTRPAIDADLVEEAFAHDIDDQGNFTFFDIDTVDKAGRWRIEVFGFGWPERIDAIAATWACTSLTRWPAGRNSHSRNVLGSESIDEAPISSPATPEARFIRVQGMDGGYFDNTCIMRRRLSTHPIYGQSIVACGINEGRQTWLGHERCDSTTPFPEARLRDYSALAIFAPDTPLVDLPAAARMITARATHEQAALAEPRLHRSCALPRQYLRIARVNEYTTLRQQPGFQAAVLERIPLGALVQVADDVQFFGDASRRNACQAACRAASTARDRPSSAVASCWLDNTLWFPARFGGQEGYVSGRFLAE